MDEIHLGLVIGTVVIITMCCVTLGISKVYNSYSHSHLKESRSDQDLASLDKNDIDEH